MVTSPPRSASRYRRRILGLGAIAVGAVYVIGAPFYVRGIENDLEARVPEALADAGFDGVTVEFSGQNGTITCDEPLSDPDGALAVGFDVRGVRDLELVQSSDSPCRVRTSDVESGESAESGDGSSATSPTVVPASVADHDGADASGEVSGDATTAPTVDASDEATGDETGLASIEGVVSANPDLAFLTVLFGSVDLDLAGESVTLFAPNNAAFDQVSADLLGQLQNDTDLLQRTLRHHLVAGSHTESDFEEGQLIALDDMPVLVEATNDSFTVGGARIVDPDVVASNGVVHVIDRLLLPPDVDLDPDTPIDTSVDVRYQSDVVTLSGVVASEVERQAIVEAAAALVGAENVTDEFLVDPDTGVDAATTNRLVGLIEAMSNGVTSGDLRLDGESLSAAVVVDSAAAADAFTTFAATVAVEPDVEIDEPTGEEAAASLEQRLNALVADEPIRFEAASDAIDPAAEPLLDALAETLLGTTGVSITIEGHTDSDGIAGENLQLSVNRAEAVRSAMVDRGVDPAQLEAVGFGDQQPILVEGVEDKDASRRVEFRVVVTP